MSTAHNPAPNQVTQARHPWRAVVRTAFAGLVGLAALMPAIVSASGLEQTSAAVGGALAISGGITRVLAVPGVEKWLRQFLPFLAAAPSAK